MHSHKTLALLALAASTASPALSAPVQESQQQARAIVDERATAAPGGVGSILKTIGTGLGLGALPVVLQDALGGDSTRRALPRDTPARNIFDGLPVDDTLPIPDTFDTFDGSITGPGINGLFNKPFPPRGDIDGLPVDDTLPTIDTFDGSITGPGINGLFNKPFPPRGDIDERAPDDFPFPLIGGVFPNGVQAGTIPGTRREKSLAPDARSILSDNGLNNFQTTDAIGNVLKFGVLTGRASETTRRDKRAPDVQLDTFLDSFQNFGNFVGDVVGIRDIDERAPDVAIDNFLSGFQGVGDFIKNVLPRSVPETTRRDIDERAPDVAIDNFLSGFQDVGDFIKNVLPRSVPETTRREPSPISASDLGGIGKTVAGTLASLAAASGVKELLSRDDASPRDLIEALQLLSRQLDELD